MTTDRELRRSRTLALLLAFAAILTLLPAGSAHAIRPVDRHNWVVGLAYGVGSASLDVNDQAGATDWTRGGTPQYRAGHMIGRHMMLGAEIRQWLDEGGIQDYKLRANVQNVSLVLTVYPGSTSNWTSGFFLQGGGGYAHGRLTALEPYPGGTSQYGETYEIVAKHDTGGTGAVVGAGYEFRISEHFAAGVTTSYNVLEFDDSVLDQVKFVPGGLNLNWYF